MGMAPSPSIMSHDAQQRSKQQHHTHTHTHTTFDQNRSVKENDSHSGADALEYTGFSQQQAMQKQNRVQPSSDQHIHVYLIGGKTDTIHNHRWVLWAHCNLGSQVILLHQRAPWCGVSLTSPTSWRGGLLHQGPNRSNIIPKITHGNQYGTPHTLQHLHPVYA